MLKLIKFISPYRKGAIAMMISSFLQVLGTLYIPTLTADIVNNGIVTGDLDNVMKTGGWMLLVAIVTACISIGGTYLSIAISTSVGKDIRNAMFRKSQSFSKNDLDQFGTASLITRATSDVEQVQRSFYTIIELLLPLPVMAISGLILAFSKDKMLAFIIVGAMILVSTFSILLAKKTTPMFEKTQIFMDKMNTILRENIIGVRVIRAFNRTNHEQKRSSKAFGNYADIGIKVSKVFAMLIPVIMTIMNLCTILIIWIGGQKVSAGTLQIGDIMALIEYSVIILMYIIMGAMVFMIIPRARACSARINEVLDTEPEFEGVEFEGVNCDVKNFNRKAKLEFQNVTFQYAGAEKAVLDKINFTTNVGQTTAIIGGTGSGKSTIASLIPRFYDIQGGHILIDGIDIRNMKQNKLREKIGFVQQKAFLFSGTIADNLRHGKKNATMEEMRIAAKIAQIDDFIDNLEKGYNSPVSQGGSNFSGGQKQRLSIARTLIKRPEIYVFDDSFSALDFKTDAKLRAALKGYTRDAAVVIVAQRVSTIIDADQIIVIDDGQIVGKGTHYELMENCPIYQQIAHSQLKKEESA